MRHAGVLSIVVCTVLSTASVTGAADLPSWAAGRWDTHFYTSAEWPRTIVYRVLVEDAETRLAVAGAEVRLEGQYPDWGSNRRAPVSKDVTLTARTNTEGVAVFLLRWQAWDAELVRDARGRRIVNDIEKVQRANVRVAGYRFGEVQLPTPDLKQAPERWVNLAISAAGAKVFVLRFPPNFVGIDDDDSGDPFLAVCVRDKEYGNVLSPVGNERFDVPAMRTNHPIYGTKSGPFLLLPIHILLARTEHTADDRPVATEVSPEQSKKPQAPAGFITDETYYNIHEIINLKMSEQEIIHLLGDPGRTWKSPSNNTVHSWRSIDNSRRGIIVVVSPEGRVTMIDTD